MAEDKQIFPFLALVAIVAIVGMVSIVGFLNNNITEESIITGYAASRIPVSVSKARADVEVTIPSHAVELAPGVFDLGTAIVNGEKVQGFMFIDYKKDFAKPPWAGGGKKGQTKCYEFLSKDTKWKLTEPYVLNPSNIDGMSDAFVIDSIGSSLEVWDSEVGFDIFGTGTVTSDTLVADTVAPDGKNEVYFGAIGGQGSIAVTIVWGIFSGPPPNRRLVEWDIVFDDAEFKFGNAGPTDETNLGDTSLMDLLNIGTHEVGHAAGLGHPTDGCTEETMHAYASFGETKKRTLNSGDISGVQSLYK